MFLPAKQVVAWKPRRVGRDRRRRGERRKTHRKIRFEKPFHIVCIDVALIGSCIFAAYALSVETDYRGRAEHCNSQMYGVDNCQLAVQVPQITGVVFAGAQLLDEALGIGKAGLENSHALTHRVGSVRVATADSPESVAFP